MNRNIVTPISIPNLTECKGRLLLDAFAVVRLRQTILRLLRNQKVHYHAHNSVVLASAVIYIHPANSFTSYFFNLKMVESL